MSDYGDRPNPNKIHTEQSELARLREELDYQTRRANKAESVMSCGHYRVEEIENGACAVCHLHEGLELAEARGAAAEREACAAIVADADLGETGSSAYHNGSFATQDVVDSIAAAIRARGGEVTTVKCSHDWDTQALPGDQSVAEHAQAMVERARALLAGKPTDTKENQ